MKDQLNEPTSTNQASHTTSEPPRQSLRARAGAAGKALIVYLGSGSVLLAILAYFLFSGMGC